MEQIISVSLKSLEKGHDYPVMTLAARIRKKWEKLINEKGDKTQENEVVDDLTG